MENNCCIKEDSIKRIGEDIDNINERLNRHSEKIDRISDNNIVLETILKRLEEDSDIQKKTNSETQKTMLSIQTAMSEITFNIRELNTKLKANDDKLDNTVNKVNEIDNRGKFEVVSFIKSTIIPALLGLGIGAYIMQFIK